MISPRLGSLGGTLVSLGPLGLVMFTSACSPSLQSKSAGHIGCAPSEIVISDQRSDVGLNQSSKTWVADCQGRRFHCSETSTSGSSIVAGSASGSYAHVSSGDSDVSCTEAVSSVEAHTPKPTKQVVSAQPKGSAPTGVAGFTFGAKASEAIERCESSGHTWSKFGKGRFLCDGPPEELGFEAQVALAYCKNRLCLVTVIHRPTGDWLGAIGSVKGALASKYGAPDSEETAIGSGCTSDERIPGCITEGVANVQAVWSWPTQERIIFDVARPTPEDDGEEGPSIRLRYIKRLSNVEAKPSAL